MLKKKGKEWALSCVALSAAVLMGISTTVQADTTGNANSTISTNGDTLSTSASSAVTQPAHEAVPNPKVKSGGSVQNDFPGAEDNNQLGYASNFHIFANEATLNVHTNGNVAVGDFYGKVNFGTNVKDGSVDKDISYIQNPNEIASSSFVDSNSNPNRTNKVVFGVNNAIDVSTSRPSINGTYLDHLKVGNDEYDAIDDDEIYQDKVKNEYVDIANYLKDFLSTKSSSLLAQ